jgi:hypothetical protein
MWKQSYFWFIQPSSVLNNYDYYFFWAFVILFAIGIIFKIALNFSRHGIYVKLINKFSNLGLTLGLSGLAWAGFRYENTPIFSDRYWAGLIFVIAIVWLLFILKYVLTKFGPERREFEKQMVNSKYIPSRK